MAMIERRMMPDAAKAAGVRIEYEEDGSIASYWNEHGDCWEPLHDDGDAFSAANKRGISIIHEHPGYVKAKRLIGGEWHIASVNNPDDYGRAARLAIVHVLAEIGRKMP